MSDRETGNIQLSQDAAVRKVMAAEEKIAMLRIILVLTLPLIYWLLMDKEGTLIWLAAFTTLLAFIYGPFVILYKPYKKMPVMKARWITYIFDTIIISLYVIATGGVHSPFYLLYIVSIVAVAFRFDFKVIMISAVLYSGIYLGIILWEVSMSEYLVEITTRILFIMIAGALGEYITKEIFKQTHPALAIQELSEDLKQSYDLGSEKENTLLQIMDHLPVGLFVVKADGTPYYINKHAFNILGKKAEVVNNDFNYTSFYNAYKIGTNEIYPNEETPLYKALQGHTSRINDMEIRRAEKVIPIEVSGAPVFDKHGKIIYASLSFNDISENKEAEERINKSIKYLKFLETTATAANFTESIEDEAKFIIDMICDFVKWPLGHIYFQNEEDHGFYPSGIWNDESEKDFSEFISITNNTPFSPGQGLPGMVFERKATVWVKRISQNLHITRREVMMKSGFISAIAFPVMIREEVVAVFEFYSNRYEPKDDELVEILNQVGLQFGRVIERIKSEENLRQREKQLQVIFKNAPDAVVVMNEYGKVVSWNNKAESMFGWKAEEVIGSMLHEFIIPSKYKEAHIKGLKHFNKTGEGPVLNKTIEIEALRRDGSEFFVELSISKPVYIKGQNQFVAFVKDITKRKEAEEVIREFASIIKYSEDAIISETIDGTIISWNPGAEKIFGYSAEEVIGKNISLLMPDNGHNEELKILEKIVRGASVEHCETSRKRKNGKQIYVSLTISPIKNEKGEIVGASKIARDISERVNKEKEINKTNKFLFTVLENLPVMVFVKDARDLKFVTINKAGEELLGIKRAEIIGKNDYDFFPKDESDFFVKKDREVLNTGVVLDIREEKINTQYGGEKWLHTVKVPVFDDSGKAEYLLGISEDITEQREVSRRIKSLNKDLSKNLIQLQEVNKELESFTYSVSHDLRAPLRAINGYTEIISEEYANVLDSEGKRMLNEVKYNSERMGKLIEDLLAFSRMGRKELVKNKVNMNELVKQVIKDIVVQSGKETVIDIKETLSVYGDRDLLHQVLFNILSNAIKYSSKESKPLIEIGSYKDENNVVYYIKDNGVGFDMNYKDKLFGVFQRLHSEKEFEGTGVGLAIVHKIITRHGGKVWAESEINKGATFYFSLPDIDISN